MRTWCGDFAGLPAYQGPADVVALHDTWPWLADPRAALVKAALTLKPGGLLAISSAAGRTPAAGGGAPLPSRAELEALTADLPLALREWRDEPGFFLALLQARASRGWGPRLAVGGWGSGEAAAQTWQG